MYAHVYDYPYAFAYDCAYALVLWLYVSIYLSTTKYMHLSIYALVYDDISSEITCNASLT